jgi:hypothetical protein
MFLDPSFLVTEIRLERQVPNNAASQALESAGENISAGMEYMAIVIIVLNTFFTNVLKKLTGTIMSL